MNSHSGAFIYSQGRCTEKKHMYKDESGPSKPVEEGQKLELDALLRHTIIFTLKGSNWVQVSVFLLKVIMSDTYFSYFLTKDRMKSPPQI